jgi:hypothetical protein
LGWLLVFPVLLMANLLYSSAFSELDVDVLARLAPKFKSICPDAVTSATQSSSDCPPDAKVRENPLGEGGEQFHGWIFPLAALHQAHGQQGGEVNESARSREIARERGPA